GAGSPLAAVFVDEVAAVDVDGAGQGRAGVGGAVDGVVAQQEHLGPGHRAATRLVEGAAAGTGAPVEGVVPLPRVDADGGPHQVVVGVEDHVGRPHDGEHGEVGRLAQPAEE